MNLTPEKRLDKTGKLVTRHVRSSSVVSSSAASLPAPSAVPRKQPHGSLKLRPKQLEEKAYQEDIREGWLSPQLQGMSHEYWDQRANFRANDVEFYSVLAVARDTDAIKILNDGVRSTEDAITYMQDCDMEPPFDRTSVVQEALRRNITPSDYRDFFMKSNIGTINENSPHIVDCMELFGIISLTNQYHDVSRLISNGEVRLEDIKKIGAVKLKGYGRLRDTIPALKALKEPDCKFNHKDVQSLLERVMPAGRDASRYKNDYETAIRYLVSYGPEFISSVNINELNGLDRRFAHHQDRMALAKFHVHFSQTQLYGRGDITTLYDAGVDPIRAAELARGGMAVNSIIGVIQEDVPSSVSSGWL